MSSTIIYVRLSQDREGAGLGVQRQQEDCEKLAADAGWPVDDIIVDNDLSASGRKPRPGYLALLSRMQAGDVARVIAWHTDRLHRSPLELEDYVTASEQHHIVTKTVKAGELDLSTPGGRMIARVHCAIAKHETEHKAERQKRAELQRAQAGGARIAGLRAYGYADDRATIIPSEAAVIRDAAARLLAGESLRSVCAELDSRGVRTVTGKPWHPTVLRSMLLRPRLAGLSAYRGEVVGKGEWQAVLDEPTWRALCAMLSDPGRRYGANSRRHLLTGLAVCAVCDVAVTLRVGAASRPINSRAGYRCAECGITRAVAWVDAYVTAAVVARLERLDLADATTTDPSERIALEARLSDAAERFAAGDISGEQLTVVSRRLRTELAKIDRVQETARRGLLAGLLGERAEEAFQARSLSQKRAVIAELVDVRLHRSPGRTFRPETIELVWR
jgi:site-specific DNA recombinase